MSWFEWWGESIDPGPLGCVRFERQEPRRRKRATVLVLGLAALLLLAGWILFAAPQFGWPRGWTALGTLLYLAVAFFVRPEPELRNVGWFGGLMDHPFRWSDDVNRWLAMLCIVLVPGRFASASIVALARLGWRAWSATDAEWNASEHASDDRRP
ncbi:MAG: hypothetical protein HZA53_10585 [Planctomycetes bacterium]|nr:hypothetical protein [Planctomycetota bacterium]